MVKFGLSVQFLKGIYFLFPVVVIHHQTCMHLNHTQWGVWVDKWVTKSPLLADSFTMPKRGSADSVLSWCVRCKSHILLGVLRSKTWLREQAITEIKMNVCKPAIIPQYSGFICWCRGFFNLKNKFFYLNAPAQQNTL